MDSTEREIVFLAPARPEIIGCLPGKVILIAESMEEAQSALGTNRDKVVRLHFVGPISEFRYVSELADLRLVIQGASLSEFLVDHAHLLRRSGTMIRLTDAVEAPKDTRVAASLSLVPDLIDLIPELGRSDIADLLKLYLYDGANSTPIEPFHSLLAGLLQFTEVDLWGIHYEDPTRHHWVNANGDLAFSRKDLREGKFVGNVTAMPGGFHRHESWQRLITERVDVFSSQPDCASCPQYALCRGWALYSTGSCEPWRGLIQELRSVAGELRSLRERFHQFASPAHDAADAGTDEQGARDGA